MFEFGDELIIDSYRIPWLIWIQLLAMFLLIILLCYFTTTSSDLSTPSDSPSATVVSFSSRSFLTSDTRHNSKIRENEIKEIGTSTSEVLQRAKKPDGRPRAESSTTNESSEMQTFDPKFVSFEGEGENHALIGLVKPRLLAFV
ncbi:hypothetical protein E3N88_12053 [Mikania micrantha]|uniref:Uncharacterized protein n=1 Tax=Mikania micrantha TaxID=192012 RepID=A0A5N6P4F1_9ASTR|nr:hypothetical protein E3N88_12053 [Mikania micrantha]